MNEAFTLWISGKPCTGKTTITRLITEEILKRNHRAEIVDGKSLKNDILNGLSYSSGDLKLNAKAVAALANVLNENGITAAASSILPFTEADTELENIVNIHLTASQEILDSRDNDGFYDSTGFDTSDLMADEADLTIDTSQKSPEAALKEIISLLEELTFIEPVQEDYNDDEKAEIDARLKSLGYM